MTDATCFEITAPAQSASLPLPKPVPFAPPVFMTDAITPLAGETVLLHLLRRSCADE